MERYEETRAAVIDLIKAEGFKGGQEFSMYTIGLTLTLNTASMSFPRLSNG